MMKDNRSKLTDPEEVVEEYLAALLAEIPPIEEQQLIENKSPTAPSISPAVVDIPLEIPNETEVPIQVDESLVKGEFQVLLFKVSGISLAVSLDKLNGILEWKELSPMPNRSSCFLGLRAERDRQIKVIDTALIVVPAKFRTNHVVENLNKVILVGNRHWGLACDEVAEVITLQQDDVRWRGDTSKRPWLAGTVVEHMCALLDVDELVTMMSTDALTIAT